MAWVMFHTFMEKQHDGSAVDFESDTIKVMLVTSVRAPVQATDTDMATIDNTEVSGDEYTAGGLALASKTIVLDTGTVTFDCDDPVWSQGSSGFTDARYAILYKSTGTPANDTPICYADLGGNKGNDDGDLTLEIAATGVFAITTS